MRSIQRLLSSGWKPAVAFKAQPLRLSDRGPYMTKIVPEYEIRNARVEDALALAAAEREIARTPGRLASRPHELKDEAFRERIAALTKSETGRYIVVESNGEVVGHALLDPF